MGGKGSAPPPPDYVGAAQQQAAASKEVTNIQNFANRPTQITPFGSTSWETNATVDPATGQPVTAWTQRTSLAPELQGALNSQLGLQQDRSNLARGFMGRVQDEYSQPFDYSLLPEVQRTQGFDSGYRDQVARTLMERMVPVHERQQDQLETRLSNQGFQLGSDAYKRALDELGQRQASERYNALDMAGNEGLRLFNMGRTATLDNNALRQQAIAEQMQRRGMSLNEMNALLSGQQVAMPQMPNFQAAQRSEAPNILGATQMGYDAQLGAYNAQQAGFNNLLGAGAQLGSAAFMFSDKRLKSNIKRVGTHAIGVGIYDYTMMGMSQRGVIAQEVERVRPDLVKRHASGYLMVNYGGL